MVTVIAAKGTFPLDSYVVDVLMRDLVGHDRSAAAFLVYLFLWRRTRAQATGAIRLSHREVAEEVGLSKSAVQQAFRILHRRALVKSKQRHRTDTPEHQVMRPWAR